MTADAHSLSPMPEGELVRGDPEQAGCGEPSCTVCGLDHEFDLPEGLIEACHGGEVVIFAGAGISTEVPVAFPNTIFQMAAHRLGMSRETLGTFPAAMQEYERRFGRADLVRLISKKFDYIDSYRDLQFHATRFHSDLATMPYFRDIVTTNWDTYFEDWCGATPFVTGEDIALWEMPGRRVLKIHGSISNLASLVATDEDYEERLAKLSSDVMGGLLRQFLATRTVIFVGYSLTDWNFRRLYEALRSDMKGFAPRAYVVSPFPVEENDLDLTVIHTSGVHFLRTIKAQLVGSCFIGDEAYDRVNVVLTKAAEADEVAKTVPHKKYPSVVYCWFYHDGLRDACDRILRLRRTGEYSDRHHVFHLVNSYDEWCDNAYDEARYHDAAYIDGYMNGLMMLLDDDWGREDRLSAYPDMEPLADSIPYYFMYGSDSEMRTDDDLAEALLLSRRRAPKERKVAREIVGGLAEDMVISHSPFIPDAPGLFT
ncbi:MAG TPA: SIR2 family protein [Acidimicrobiales bacterium]|nr:SIR2 family protein [Acidimicrobiales bacterium]